MLITAIRRAVDTGVEPPRIVAVLDMADAATGTEQAPAWRMCAKALDGYSDAIKPAE